MQSAIYLQIILIIDYRQLYTEIKILVRCSDKYSYKYNHSKKLIKENPILSSTIISVALESFHDKCFLPFTTTILFAKLVVSSPRTVCRAPTINFLTKRVNSPAQSPLLIRWNVYSTFHAHFVRASKYTTVENIDGSKFVRHILSSQYHLR